MTLALKMSARAKTTKRKVDVEGRLFNKIGHLSICLLKLDVTLCLVCREQIAELKDESFNRRYKTKHTEKRRSSTDAESARTSKALLAELQK